MNYKKKIVIDQGKAMGLGLDIIEYSILYYLNSKKRTRKEWIEIKYENFIKEMPLLGLKNPDSVYRRLKKLHKKDMIRKISFHNGPVLVKLKVVI